MSRRIENPADTPAEVYHYWHERWCAILRDSAGAFLDAGLAGVSFTERVPDAPDGKGAFSYAFDENGRIEFTQEEGQAIAEYGSYELGLRMLSDADFDPREQIEQGRFRITRGPEHWDALMRLLPLLSRACHRAIEEAEEKFDLELPKYW